MNVYRYVHDLVNDWVKSTGRPPSIIHLCDDDYEQLWHQLGRTADSRYEYLNVLIDTPFDPFGPTVPVVPRPDVATVKIMRGAEGTKLAEFKGRMDTPSMEPESTSQPIDDPRKDYSWVPQEHERFEGDAFRNSDGAWIRLYNAGQHTREDAANCAIEYWQGIKDSLNSDVVIRHIIAARKWRDAR